MNRSQLVIALSLILATGLTQASSDREEREEHYQRRGPMPFEVFDLNKDGSISREEHSQVRGERMASRAAQGYPMRNAGSAPSFEELDNDHNGSLSREELQEGQMEHMQKRRGMGPGMPANQ